MDPKEAQIRMFGVELRHIDEMVEKSPSTPSRLAFNLLSDVQEMIARDMKEEARQAINRVKYIIDEHVEK